MRLEESEIFILKELSKKFFGENFKMYLFGSRVDDNKKGGDIDIFIDSSKEIDFKKQIEFLSEVELNGILRKVDLVVKTPKSKHQNIFDTAMKTGVLL